jgi:hypothetical protein
VTSVIRTLASSLRAVLRLFVDDGVYAAVTIAWIAVIVTVGPRGVSSRMVLVVLTFGSHHINGQAVEGLLLALGLDLIFTVSVILRVRGTVRTMTSRGG